MNLNRDWKDGDVALALGAGMYLMFTQIQLLTSGVLELSAMFLSLLGLGCMILHLRRSNLERAMRWFLGANLIHVLLFLFRNPEFADYPLSRVAILTLVIGLIGSLVPTAMRRKAYGLLLAFLWATLLGMGWEELRTKGPLGVAPILLLAGVLAAVTTFYARWARTGQFPRAFRDVMDQLPKDDAPLKSTLHTVTYAKSLPEPSALEKEPELERVRVGER